MQILLHKYAFMRITIDLPDGLYREAKTRAEKEGITLKDLVVGLIQVGLRAKPTMADARQTLRRTSPPVAIRRTPGSPLANPLSSRQLQALIDDEDRRQIHRDIP